MRTRYCVPRRASYVQNFVNPRRAVGSVANIITQQAEGLYVGRSRCALPAYNFLRLGSRRAVFLSRNFALALQRAILPYFFFYRVPDDF